MWLVFFKELKELLRDRKTLFFMIALPILIFPLIIGGVVYFTDKAVKEAQSETLDYAIVGSQFAPDLAEKLNALSDLNLVVVPINDNHQQLIAADTVDFIIEIPANYSEHILQSGQATINVYLNDARINKVVARVEGIIKEQTNVLRQTAFESLHLNSDQGAALITPIVLNKIDTANQRESLGEKLGGMIPYMIFILCLQGAMFPAGDLGAGEKERGTLETLLISPIERYKLVLGKFFTVAAAGITTALITVASMALWGTLLSKGMAVEFVVTFMSSIGALDFVLIFLMLIPVVAIFASILLSLSIYAKSYKEAQSYMGTLVILVIIPIIFALLPNAELKGGWAWVPLTNVALAIKELVKGTMDYYQLFAIFGSTALIAGALIAFCIHWFNKEKVLFR
ncbi:ABC transporter permease [Aliiglaciecola litoralis]|uniref:ABC-2 type transporter transmembrane domain-containing protein n=1 Tax=Aliiglaciecola litoralis TaxID=582857 RepID=A0ABN1LNJ1_9ALTE